ncbi:MAG: ABC-F family ATP-binding cassette domain-containing protein, partial [Nocardiopsis sp. BM-2018]
QNIAELDPAMRPLQAVMDVREHITIGKRDYTASQMLEKFGFRGERQWTPIGDLSGGEKRRLQLLRLLMDEPNVLLLDEPTNDLDIETLTELEDLLDGWPGSLVLVSHDRYFLERITDRVLALMGDGTLAFLPNGVDEYLERRAATADEVTVPLGASEAAAAEAAPAAAPAISQADRRAAQKEMQRVERRMDKIAKREAQLHEQMAAAAEDYTKLAELDAEAKTLAAEKDELEMVWLEQAELIGD